MFTSRKIVFGKRYYRVQGLCWGRPHFFFQYNGKKHDGFRFIDIGPVRFYSGIVR